MYVTVVTRGSAENGKWTLNRDTANAGEDKERSGEWRGEAERVPARAGAAGGGAEGGSYPHKLPRKDREGHEREGR